MNVNLGKIRPIQPKYGFKAQRFLPAVKPLEENRAFLTVFPPAGLRAVLRGRPAASRSAAGV
eukprot:2254614-Rhodomonas_salina.2